MNDPENFLTRWSRRKREEAAEPTRPRDENEGQRTPETPPAQPSAGDAPPPVAAEKLAEPVFDLSTLPPIETIASETDIRAFLAPGVPAELRLAALRRAWIADPKVRDFVGLNDYDFDFHTPGAIPGFGSLEMTDDLRREVSKIVTGWQSELEQAAPRAAPATTPAPEPKVSSAQPAAPAAEMNPPSTGPTSSAAGERDAIRDQAAPPQDELITDQATTQRNKDSAAPQQQHSQPENLQTLARRGHGGALPK
jgi:Protein of unknown function (DUF3306)